MSTNTWWETVGGTGSAVLDQLRKLLAEGNIRRVRVRQKGQVIAEFPLTVGWSAPSSHRCSPPSGR